MRLFDPDSGTLAYCGHLVVPISSRLVDLIPEMTRRAFWNEEPKEDEVLIFEDRHLGFCVHQTDLQATMNEALLFFKATGPGSPNASEADIEDGVVLIFQVE